MTNAGQGGAKRRGGGGTERRGGGRQLTLDQARKPDVRHGGWRPRAGRKRGRTVPGHVTRPGFAARFPLHVTLRIVPGVASLRREQVVRAIRRVIAAAGHHDDFRVVEFNVLANHVHLLVEAAGKDRLARRMNGLLVRIVRAVNPLLGRRGKLFAHRYHARILRTPREVRAVLAYVLQNARHHAAQQGRALPPTWLDPYSSAAWFTGWRDAITYPSPVLRALRHLPRPTAPPRTWLLTDGWRVHGALRFDEIGAATPGPSPRVARERRVVLPPS